MSLVLHRDLRRIVELGRTLPEIDAPSDVDDEVLVAAIGHVDAAADRGVGGVGVGLDDLVGHAARSQGQSEADREQHGLAVPEKSALHAWLRFAGAKMILG